MAKTTNQKTNPRLTHLIATLKDTARENDAKVWRAIAQNLESPSRNYAEVNIGKINRYAQDGETILVPGKVLGSGVLNQKVSVAALNFSESAISKINGLEGSCMTIEELVQTNPKGSGVRILR
ncbi:50S ribosomal protein L18e [Methanofollis aquaemaris]|uniref:Large ribosomal subunit protein eL18 n=1 Tax=Methanofollis aquaemaris TaxID=126734 RepID=A0A8A3S7S7_9EURY|nr:50S ribosomal protein L18e [Methanofollis aquaemaris]QSZ67740.1 50S ribosomal protein L18e [Methanofollis aquaemaris]